MGLLATCAVAEEQWVLEKPRVWARDAEWANVATGVILRDGHGQLRRHALHGC